MQIVFAVIVVFVPQNRRTNATDAALSGHFTFFGFVLYLVVIIQ